MDRSSARNNLMLSKSFGLQGSQQVNHHQNSHSYQGLVAHPQKVQNVFPFTVGNMQQSNQHSSLFDRNDKGKGVMNFGSHDDQSKVVGQCDDGQIEGGREKNDSLWKHLKWTNEMVKLLITAVSYIEEDANFDCNTGGGTTKVKWKVISKVMLERGYNVLPQQCEDKFNDLNKKYNRLNDILGRGNCCRIVENPALLDSMDLSETARGDVRKILSSKQLFFQELRSYHNGNQLFLPHDWDILQSLQLALKRKYGYEHPVGISGLCAKRKKQAEELEDVGFSNGKRVLNCNIRSFFPPPTDSTIVNHVPTEGGEREWLQNRQFMSRSIQLEEKKLQIQEQMLELEMRRFKWLRVTQKEDTELGKLRLENERVKLENEYLKLEIERLASELKS